jgi:hypothetical protein
LPPLLSHDDFVIRPSSADIIKKVKPPEELIDKKKLDSLKKENERKIIEKPKPEKNPTPAPRIGALNMSDFETYQKYAKLINDYASSIVYLFICFNFYLFLFIEHTIIISNNKFNRMISHHLRQMQLNF